MHTNKLRVVQCSGLKAVALKQNDLKRMSLLWYMGRTKKVVLQQGADVHSKIFRNNDSWGPLEDVPGHLAP